MDECHKHVIWFVSPSQVSWRTPVSQYLKGPSWRCHTPSLSMCFSSCSLVPPATGAVYETQATCKFTQCVYTVLCSPSHLSLHFPSVISWSLSLRLLLINDYAVFQRVNVWPPLVTIGVYCASLSAAMCSMIGASRILHALALDKLFG